MIAKTCFVSSFLQHALPLTPAPHYQIGRTLLVQSHSLLNCFYEENCFQLAFPTSPFVLRGNFSCTLAPPPCPLPKRMTLSGCLSYNSSPSCTRLVMDSCISSGPAWPATQCVYRQNQRQKERRKYPIRTTTVFTYTKHRSAQDAQHLLPLLQCPLIRAWACLVGSRLPMTCHLRL